MSDDRAARARAMAEELLGGASRRNDGAIWFPGLDGDGFDVFVKGLVACLLEHTATEEALRAEVERLTKALAEATT